MNYSKTVKNKLLSIIDQMDRVHWLFTRNPNTDFCRTKKWSFTDIMRFILAMEGKAIKDELLEHFNFSKNTPSGASLINAVHRFYQKHLNSFSMNSLIPYPSPSFIMDIAY